MELKQDNNSIIKKKKKKKKTLDSNVEKFEKQTNKDIYIISCFNNSILEKELFILKSTNKEVKSIEDIDKKVLIYDKKFYTIIHKINLEEGIKALNLILISEENNKLLNLNQINFNNGIPLVLFDDIDINQKELNEFRKDIKKQEFVRILTASEKLKIFYEYFIQKNEQDINKIKSIKNFLAIQYLNKCRKDNKIAFSDFIKVLCLVLVYKEKSITHFLDIYENYDLEFDKFKNEEFENILNIYDKVKNEKKEFLNNNNFGKSEKKNLNEYEKALDNFISLYKLIYRFKESSKLLSEEQLKNLKSVLIKLINNKKEIIKKISFIFSYFEEIFFVFARGKDKEEDKFDIIIESNDDLLEFNYETFKAFYNELIKEQEKKNKYFLNFSSVFNSIIKIIDDCEILIEIKKLYSKELQIFFNEGFENKINELIHKKGILKISQGKYDNNFLILFLKNDCKYKDKNYELLRYFNIELMDDNFFKYFEEFKIYSLYEKNFVKYLEQFTSNLKDIKYFYIFFKILPPQEYSQKTIEFVFNWLKDNINTFDIVKCKNFKEVIFIFFNIIADNKMTDTFTKLINLIKNNIYDLLSDICISLINQKKFQLQYENIKNLITNLLFTDKDINNNLNLGKIKFFLKEVELNNQILEIFFLELRNFPLIEDDFYDENSERFKLLETILETKKININAQNILSYDYLQNTINTCKSLVNELENLNIIYEQIQRSFKIMGKENMEERFNCIYKIIQGEGYDQNKLKQIFGKICNILDEWEIKIKKIESMKEYNLFINDKNEEVNKINTQLSEFNKKIFNSTLDYLNKEESRKEFSKFINEKSFEKIKKILKLRDSNIFIKIFNHLQKEYKEAAPEKSITEFEKLKNLFSDNERKILNEIKTNKYLKFFV